MCVADIIGDPTVFNWEFEPNQFSHFEGIFDLARFGVFGDAVNFTFRDEEKTLTDKEIDGWMDKIMAAFEKDLQAEIRK